MSDRDYDGLVKRLDEGDPCGEYTCRVRDARSGCTCTEAAAAIRELQAERDRLRAGSVEEITLVLYNQYRERCRMRPVDYIGANKTPQVEECREDARAVIHALATPPKFGT